MFALWCFPARLSQASSAELSCTQCSSVPPSEQLHSSTAHNSSLWIQRSPGHSSQCLNTVSCWAHTHCQQLWSHSPRPQTTREAMQIYGVSHTLKHTHTLTHLTYMKGNTQPSGAVTEVTQLLSLMDADDKVGVTVWLINLHQKPAGWDDSRERGRLHEGETAC